MGPVRMGKLKLVPVLVLVTYENAKKASKVLHFLEPFAWYLFTQIDSIIGN